MTNYILQPNESILYRGDVNLEKRNTSAELILTNLNLVFVITIRKFFTKNQIEVETHSIKEIKFYNNIPQIKQKNSHVEIFLTSDEITVSFSSIFEAGKFVNAALHLLTGKTMAERSANKVKGAVGLVDNTLGINTIGTVKNVLENGIAHSLLGGFGKKVPSLKGETTVSKAVGIVKDLLEPQTSQGSPSNSIPVSAPTDEQVKALKQMKELVDAGILTQEEFDAKKKQLLNL